MDANKRERLIEIGYQVLPTCQSCTHFSGGSDPWFGDCTLHTYDHLKHSGEDGAGRKRLSVVRHGSCQRYDANMALVARIHGFSEFIK